MLPGHSFDTALHLCPRFAKPAFFHAPRVNLPGPGAPRSAGASPRTGFESGGSPPTAARSTHARDARANYRRPTRAGRTRQERAGHRATPDPQTRTTGHRREHAARAHDPEARHRPRRSRTERTRDAANAACDFPNAIRHSRNVRCQRRAKTAHLWRLKIAHIQIQAR